MEKRDRQNLNLALSTQTAPSCEQSEHQRNSPVQTSMFPNRWERIGLAAKREGIIFTNLLTHIKVDTLREAFKALSGSKALGVDRQSKQDYGKNLEANLLDLENRIHKGSYKPQVMREVLIPKAKGKTRPIAISCFEDKLVEWVVGKILETVYEPIFIINSFGFRPKKSAHDAIKAAYYALRNDHRRYVVEIDFANCFNSIPHRKLMKVIGKRITDRRFKGLIGRFLKVGILNQLKVVTESKTGTPQGSIMSPILANVYLHEVLDTWFIEHHARPRNVMVRYADDAILLCSTAEGAKALEKTLEVQVKKYGLELNKEKTKIIFFGKDQYQSFDFLGFTFFWGRKRKVRGRQLMIKTCKERLLKKIQDFYSWIKAIRSKERLEKIWELAKTKLQGHYNYFGFWMNRHKLLYFYRQAINSMFKWLNRRSQKRSFNWEKFGRRLIHNPLPLPPEVRQLKQIGWNPYV